MGNDYFEKHSRLAIAKALEGSEGKPDEVIRFRLREAYPFGPGKRSGRAYKVWRKLVLAKEKELGFPPRPYNKKGSFSEQ